MSEAEKTVRMRPFPDNAAKPAPQSNLTEEQDNALELVKRTAKLEESKKKVLEQEQTIEELRANLSKEQAKSSELTKKLSALEAEHKAAQGSSGKVAELEAKVKELSEVLGKISGIAASGKAG